jgi:hypothetical protein
MDQLCGITLVHQPQQGWVSTIAKLKDALKSKYGKPTNESQLLGPCQEDQQAMDCIEGGSLKVMCEWQWPTREKVRFLVAPPTPETDAEPKAAIRLIYTKPPEPVQMDRSEL